LTLQRPKKTERKRTERNCGKKRKKITELEGGRKRYRSVRRKKKKKPTKGTWDQVF